MSKRGRDDDNEALRRAVELLCQRQMTAEELSVAAKLTPLERQVVSLKESLPPDVILMVACGYRVKFYGRDSHVASRRLGIMCIAATPFEYSSVPYSGVNNYVHRLVTMGYRVAFADQQNASLHSNEEGAKSGLFSREVGRVFSRGTMLPDDVVVCACPAADGSHFSQISEEPPGDETPTPVEEPSLAKEGTSELFICFVWPSTTPSGVTVVEVVLVSFVTYSLLRHRIVSGTEFSDVLLHHNIVEVVLFYGKMGARENDSQQNTAAAVGLLSPLLLSGLPEAFASPLSKALHLHHGPTVNGEEDDRSVTLCAAPFVGTMDDSIARYLRPSRLDATFTKMCSQDTPLRTEGTADGRAAPTLELPGTTVSALDIFHSSVGRKGSLLALLDHSITVAGARRLRAWLAAPLCDVRSIAARREAVSVLLHKEGKNPIVGMLREFARFGDLEAILGKLRSLRCSVVEYLKLLRAMRTTYKLAVDILSGGEEMCAYINETLMAIMSADVESFLRSRERELELEANSPQEFYAALGSELPESMRDHAENLKKVLCALDMELERVRKTLGLPALEYRTIAGTTFIVEVPNARASNAPSEWIVLTRTKTHTRFHTPMIVDFVSRLCSARERLAAAANEVWLAEQSGLVDSATTMGMLVRVINSVAVLDALHCLAVASSAPGYVVPAVEDDMQSIEIRDGRHPVVDSLLRGAYVGCDVSLVRRGAWILTGPNMGGKSALMRMVGTFVILAQLGCYVPAKSARLPVFRGLYCRMGSSDSLFEGSSTFLMEMEETSRILGSEILSSSLVLLDELGRGTSSFDGVAVAAATLEYLLKHGATTLFVTHYSQLCKPYVNPSANQMVSCYYMGYREEKVVSGDGEEELKIVFTYTPVPGVSPSSFGMCVARMAGLPPAVVAQAQMVSEACERSRDMCLSLLELRRFVRSKS